MKTQANNQPSNMAQGPLGHPGVAAAAAAQPLTSLFMAPLQTAQYCGRCSAAHTTFTDALHSADPHLATLHFPLLLSNGVIAWQ
jgi:hypothetical protein